MKQLTKEHQKIWDEIHEFETSEFGQHYNRSDKDKINQYTLIRFLERVIPEAMQYMSDSIDEGEIVAFNPVIFDDFLKTVIQTEKK